MNLKLIWNAIPSKVRLGLLIILISLVSYAFGRYYTSTKTKIETVTHTVVVDHHDIRTVIHVIHEPNGTTTTTTTTQDNSTIVGGGKSTASSTTTAHGSKGNKWQVNALAGLDFHSGQPVYGVGVNKKILGPIYVGAWGLTNSSVGISVGLEF